MHDQHGRASAPLPSKLYGDCDELNDWYFATDPRLEANLEDLASGGYA